MRLPASKGYTIVETMIFLAVSGLMFVLAASFISGKQAAVEFKQSAENLNSQIEQVIGSVSNGYYPFNSNFTCSYNGDSATITTIAGNNGEGTNGPSGSQGSQSGCTYLGRAIQFCVGTAASSCNEQNYNVYTIAGSQYANGGDPLTSPPPSSYQEAYPVVLDCTANLQPLQCSNINFSDTQQDTTGGGLAVYKVVDNYSTGQTEPYSAIAFLSSPAGVISGPGGSSGQLLDSGAQTINPVPIVGANAISNGNLGNTYQSMLGILNNSNSYSNYSTFTSAQICLTGGGNQYAEITIGSSALSAGLTSQLQFSNSPPTGC